MSDEEKSNTSEGNALDSDEGQYEDMGQQRGDDMVDANWNTYTSPEKNLWEKARERFAQNDEKRQAAKIAHFAHNVDEDGEEIGKQFFGGDMADFEQRWGDETEP